MSASTINDRTILGLALTGALGVTFDQWLDVIDQWQPDWAATHKRLYGQHRVYLDGTRVGQEPQDKVGQHTLTATQLGRLACAVHVAMQTGAHLAATTAITRMVGYRIPPAALLAGVAINAPTHFALDRGRLMEILSDLLGKTFYINNFGVVRKPGADPMQVGPGTAWNEMDRSAHRGIGWFATAVTVYLALKLGGRK